MRRDISNGSVPANKPFGLLKKEWTVHFTANFFGSVSDLWLPVAFKSVCSQFAFIFQLQCVSMESFGHYESVDACWHIVLLVDFSNSPESAWDEAPFEMLIKKCPIHLIGVSQIWAGPTSTPQRLRLVKDPNLDGFTHQRILAKSITSGMLRVNLLWWENTFTTYKPYCWPSTVLLRIPSTKRTKQLPLILVYSGVRVRPKT